MAKRKEPEKYQKREEGSYAHDIRGRRRYARIHMCVTRSGVGPAPTEEEFKIMKKRLRID